MGDSLNTSGAGIASIITTGGIGNVLAKKSGIGKKKSAPGKSLDEALAAQALEFLTASRSTRDEFFDQLAEGLQTGRLPEQLMPQAQAGVEQALSKGSQEVQAVKDAYGQGGQGRTTGAVNTEAQTLLRANQAKESVPTDILNAILLASPNAVIGQAGQTGLQGLGELSNLSTMIAMQRQQSSGAALGALGAGAGGLVGSGIKAYSAV